MKIEEPLSTDYKGITVYKFPAWQQGPVMLQTLNILENVDLKALGYNSAAYIHTLYQAMNLAYADRDFYYGDPAFPPAEPVRGFLSKAYAKARLATMNRERNDTTVKPGDPYPYQDGTNPFAQLLERWTVRPAPDTLQPSGGRNTPLGARCAPIRPERAVLRRHHLDRGRRRGRLGRLGDAERWLGAGGDRRTPVSG